MTAPLVLAHRGASAYRPELTEAALRMAIAQGADGIEIDVVPSRDGHLVVRHDRALSATTDVLSRLGHRRVDDLDRAAIGRLRARERWPSLRPASARFDGREPLLTLPDAVRIAVEADVLLVVEIKDAAAFAAVDLDPAPLVARDLDGVRARVVLESFEKAPLDALRPLGLPLVYLLDEHGRARDERPDGPDYAAELSDPATLSRFSGLSVPIPLATAERVAAVHAAGLQAWAWTLRAENAFLPGPRRLSDDPAALGDWRGAWAEVVGAGVDAVFTDHPDLAVRLRDEALHPA